MLQPLGYFAPDAWYAFCASPFLPSVLSTKELHHGEESEEGKEENEEEVVSSVGVWASQLWLWPLDLAAGHIQPPFACAICLTHSEARLRLETNHPLMT